jgi:ABC-type amino acid transport substrate-binding protein
MRGPFTSIFAAVFCSFLMLFSGCAKKQPPLVVLTTGETVPFSMVGEDGELTGFDIDLVRLFAKSIKRDVEFRRLPFNEVLTGIQSRSGELAVAAISVTENRKTLFKFSEPYHESGFVLILLESSSSDLNDLSNNKKMIGVRKGTWQETAVKSQWVKIPNLFVQSLEGHISATEIVSKLRSGDLACFILDADEARYIVAHNNGLKVAPLDVGSLSMAAAFPQGSPFLDDFNHFLLAANIDDLKVKWFSNNGG